MGTQTMTWRVSTLGWLVLAGLAWMSTAIVSAQISIPTGATPYTQAFSIGTSATASMPTNWRIDRNGSARTVGSWTGAGSTTKYRAGDSMSSSADGGVYNLGAGPASSATDRAAGWLISDSGDTGNLYVRLQNNTGAALTGLVLSYDIE